MAEVRFSPVVGAEVRQSGGVVGYVLGVTEDHPLKQLVVTFRVGEQEIRAVYSYTDLVRRRGSKLLNWSVVTAPDGKVLR